MSRKINLTVLWILLSAITGFAVRAGAEFGTKSPAHDNTAFTLRLYNKLASTEGNIFFSPYSISSAMGMTYTGARANTAVEIAKALDFTATPEQLPGVYKELNAALQVSARSSHNDLRIANGICLTGGNVGENFKVVLRENFDAEVFSGSLDTINDWVKEKTKGKIEKILDMLSPNSVCVLLNAIYFKANWASRFNLESTLEAPFRPAIDKQVTVPFMHQEGKYKLLERDSFQALVMPYAGETLSMVIILPKAVDGLAALERTLTHEAVSSLIGEAENQVKQTVEVSLPRFKIEAGYDLIEPFKLMGIQDAFNFDRADFSGMGWPKGTLEIAQIKHKAYLEVNEEGTEAAGATAVEMVTKSFKIDHTVFNADHPFLFIIRDRETGSILFMGRLSDPTKQH